MPHLKFVLTILLLLFFVPVYSREEVNLGIVVDCENSQSLELARAILDEARVLLGSKTELVLKEEHTLYSGCNENRVRENFEKLLNDDNVDMILGMSPISSHVMARGGPYGKPVIAVIVLNTQVQNIPMTRDATSGVKNLNYLELPVSPIRDLEIFQRLIGFTKLGVIVDESIFAGVPELKAFTDAALDTLAIDYEYIYTEKTAQAVLESIDDRFDGIIFFPSDHMTGDQHQLLIEGINEKKIKSFSVFGRVDVERGVLAGVAMSNQTLVSRRIALNIQRILGGEDPEDLGVKMLYNEEFVLNMATARQVGYSPSWEVLTEALLINEDRKDIERTVNLFSVIAEGIQENLSVKVADREVAVAGEEIKIAKSSLLPDLGASASYTVIDQNTASISQGLNPENLAAGSLELQQVIYSEPVTANKQIQDMLFKASKAALESQTLDIVLEVSTVYLNLMQAKTAENIQKQNLEVTRKNLELARVSSSLGHTGPSDLYRWQGEIATAKSDLLNATATRRRAQLALNQVLNRPIDEPFLTEEVDLTDERFVVNNEALQKYVNNPKEFYRFADFMVSRAKKRSPDLLQFDHNIAARERNVKLNKRTRYVPNIALGGTYNYQFYRGGSGSDLPPAFDARNDWNWNLQLGASLPIYQGGNRNAQVQQSRYILEQSVIQRLNTERQVEQKIRSEMENIRASYANLGLTKEAEEAVVKNFELVQDSYAQGMVTITQLLDAQNAARTALFNSANAIFVFLIDLLNLERPTGNYFMLMTEEQKSEFLSEFLSFINEY
ncbi:MAG: TolC family protein [Cytophagales bacterium]|nr:TolC family protein [Cytophagales bacterium]